MHGSDKDLPKIYTRVSIILHEHYRILTQVLNVILKDPSGFGGLQQDRQARAVAEN